MACEFTCFEKFPLELGEKIFDDSVTPPGIHFYRYIANKSIVRFARTGWIVPGHFSHSKPLQARFGHRLPGKAAQDPCYCHRYFVTCSHEMLCHPTGDFFENRASFSARSRPTDDASSYMTADILAETSGLAKDAVARCFAKEAVYEMHGKKPVQICDQWFRFKSRLLRRDKDVFCLQLGFDPWDLGLYLDPIDPRLDVSDRPDMVGLKRLAFEWRPWVFMMKKTLRWRAKFTMPESETTGLVEYYSIECKRQGRPRKEKELWRLMPQLETVYFIDYSISVKEGHPPDPTSEVFQGHKCRFVEVKPDDNAFAFDETRVVEFKHEVRSRITDPIQFEVIKGEQPTSLNLAQWLQERSRVDKARSEGINCAPAGNSSVGCTKILDSDGNLLDQEWSQVEPWIEAPTGDGLEEMPAGDGLEERKDYPYPFRVKVLACVKD